MLFFFTREIDVETKTERFLKQEVFNILAERNEIFKKKDFISAALKELNIDQKELLKKTYENVFDTPFSNYPAMKWLAEGRDEFIIPEDYIKNISRVMEILNIDISFEKIPDNFLARYRIVCGIPLWVGTTMLFLYSLISMGVYLESIKSQYSILLVLIIPIYGSVFVNIGNAIQSKYKVKINFK